ncbi:hypothetical protein KXX47_008084, partial [Aspergillus fumigatus]
SKTLNDLARRKKAAGGSSPKEEDDGFPIAIRAVCCWDSLESQCCGSGNEHCALYGRDVFDKMA